MKRIFPMLAAALMLGVCLSFFVSADNCPYDDDLKYVVKKALTDYYVNSGNSALQPSEVGDLLAFYLGRETVTGGDCPPEMGSLIEKAENNISDDVFSSTGKSFMEKCNVCPDGSVCGEKNAKDQTCTCKDVDNDMESEFCFLKPINPPINICEVCPDGTVCDEENAKGQNCVCKDVNGDDKFEYCYLRPLVPTPPATCDKCDDGTACGQANTAKQTCQCTDTNNDGKYDVCQINKPVPPVCDKCVDGTGCGRTNGVNQTCQCTDTNKDGKYEVCQLTASNTVLHHCTKCSDGTACGRTNGSNLCACNQESYWSRYYYTCQLQPTCFKCADGTACGQNNTNGDRCLCSRKQDNGEYYSCRMECTECSDGTSCGKDAADGKTCVCRQRERWNSDKYLECLLRCGSCSDGTRCGKSNTNGDKCVCSGIDFRSRKYEECTLNPKNPTTTTIPATTTSVTSTTTSSTTSSTTTTTPPAGVKCTTSLDCYDKLGICWVCPDGGGECKTMDIDIKACPDCTGFGAGFDCYNSKNGNGPYCCYKVGDTFANATCNDGTPVNTCSKNYPGLYCNTPIDELKPWPACYGINCTDSDGGKNLAKYGECSDVIKHYAFLFDDDKYTDQCNANTLTETYCNANQCTQGDISCPAGSTCTGGACVLVTTTTTTPGATTTTAGATTTTSSTTTTTTPQNPLTAANLQKCMDNCDCVLKTNTFVCPGCRAQKAVFYNEKTAPVGPGQPAYDDVADDPQDGLIPTWECTINGKAKSNWGCLTFPELNTWLKCNLAEVPGHTYQSC